jgi:lysophospholipase L1-like esterase
MIRRGPGGSYAVTVLRRLLRTVAAAVLGLGVAAAVAFASPADAGYQGDYYVALGDSLSVGIQPDRVTGGRETSSRDAYPEQLADAMRARGRHVRLADFGCSGATTTELLYGGRCRYLGSDSQLLAAMRFMESRHAPIGVITVDIGINDIIHCLYGFHVAQPCVRQGLAAVSRNLPIILEHLRVTAPTAHVAAMTYYDPKLAFYLDGPAGQAYARRTVPVFDQLNRIIEASCRRTGVAVADVAGRYDSAEFGRSTALPDGREVPQPVARICQWTWMCAPPPVGPNLHANRPGYGELARAFAAGLRLDTAYGTPSGSPPPRPSP